MSFFVEPFALKGIFFIELQVFIRLNTAALDHERDVSMNGDLSGQRTEGIPCDAEPMIAFLIQFFDRRPHDRSIKIFDKFDLKLQIDLSAFGPWKINQKKIILFDR